MRQAPPPKEAVSISENLTGEEYYRRFIDGDTGAFEQLVALYRRGLTLFINSMVHNIDDAEELMIDAFAQLAVGKKHFEGRSSLKTYLFAIGRNIARRYIKKRNAQVPVESVTGGTSSPESDYLEEERGRELYLAIKRLKREQGEALFLLYFEDMSYSEAGKVLHKTASQIGSLVYRAKAALKTELESGGFTYP